MVSSDWRTANREPRPATNDPRRVAEAILPVLLLLTFVSQAARPQIRRNSPLGDAEGSATRNTKNTCDHRLSPIIQASAEPLSV